MKEKSMEIFSWKNLTIDEAMTMPIEQLNKYIDQQEKLLEEGVISIDDCHVDFMGMTDEEIVKKYGLVSMDEYLVKLNKRFADKYGEDWGKIH